MEAKNCLMDTLKPVKRWRNGNNDHRKKPLPTISVTVV